MIKSIVPLLLAASLAGAATAGVHPAKVEQQLAFLVNDWTIAGNEAVYRDDCRWFDDRSFVVCDTRDARDGKSHRSIAIVGWSAAAGNFTYQQYDNKGRGRSEACYANDERGLTCLGERRGADGLTQVRTFIAPSQNGLTLRQIKSVNAGPWVEVGKVNYIASKGRQ